MIWIGWNPTPLLERMEPSVRAVIERVEGATTTASGPPSVDAAVPAEEAE
jgi:hypothetical protein